jgi:GMP synthase (glutamine-hydrolysing)
MPVWETIRSLLNQLPQGVAIVPAANPILILKTGSTFDELVRTRDDFEHWTASGMGLESGQVSFADVRRGDPLPAPEELAGCVVTGSHDMVTDDADWMLATGRWLALAHEAGLPLLGICFGHQLMAHALGGRAGYHPRGPEIGTVTLTLTPEAADDPLFSQLPAAFPAHVTHSQTALTLPPNSTVLAASDHDPHQAFRLGRHTWGVQFHPEFDAEATRHYTRAQAAKIAEHGGDVQATLAAVTDTPHSAGLLRLFADYCRG